MLSEATLKTDSTYRKTAVLFIDKLAKYIENNANGKLHSLVGSDSGAFLLDGGDVDRNFKGLMIYLSAGERAKLPSFGVYKNKPIIMIPVLKSPGDLQYVDTRIIGMKSTILHELIHYFDYLRYKGDKDTRVRSSDVYATGGTRAYINTDSEFNAYFSEGAHELERIVLAFVRKNVPTKTIQKILPLKFSEFIQPTSLKRHWSDIYIDNIDGKYKRKFLKRLVPLHSWYVKKLYRE